MGKPEVSAKAGQAITVTYPDNLPERMVYGKTTLREITFSTEAAVELYEQLRHALFD